MDMLVEIAPEIYKPYVVGQGKNKLLYVIVKKAIYGMLTSALLFYKQWKKDLEGIGFKINPYDPCVANKMVNGKQLTVTWHVDDLKVSHVDQSVVLEFVEWVKKLYGQIGNVKDVHGDKHKYLGMTLDYSKKGSVMIDMRDYVDEMLREYPEEVNGKVKSPATEKLFSVNDSSPKLEKKKAEAFHSMVAKGLFISKRGRPDILLVIAFLSTRVQQPTVEDWSKLHRMMQWLKATRDDILTIAMTHPEIIKWYIDAAFAVHPDMRSHTGAYMTMGEGAAQSMSAKQKMNTRSSTEAELAGVDAALSNVIWTRNFLLEQGLNIKHNVVFQDNQSAILLENNGRASAGKRSRHMNIKLFYVTDKANNKELEIQYCPTDDMVGDYFTKALQGRKLNKFRQVIMNLE